MAGPMSEHGEKGAACPRTLRWTPRDGETGRDLPEQLVHCTLPTGHDGYHRGNDGLPFGPWRTPPTEGRNPGEEA